MNVATSIIINKSPEEVFKYVTTIENDHKWRTGVVKSEYDTHKPQLGTIGTTIVDNNSKEVTAKWEIIELRGTKSRWKFITGPFVGTGGYIAEEFDGATKFTLDGDVRMKGFGIIFTPLVGILGKKQNKADIEKLKDLLESQ